MGDLILWILVTAALATFVVETAFVYVATAKRLLKRNLLALDMKLVAYIWLAVGYPADIAFNWTRGWIMFRRRPREFLFSETVQWIVDHRSEVTIDQWQKAHQWAAVLNEIDPGHIRLGPR